MDLTISRDSFL